jgi:hypothetical protein
MNPANWPPEALPMGISDHPTTLSSPDDATSNGGSGEAACNAPRQATYSFIKGNRLNPRRFRRQR